MNIYKAKNILKENGYIMESKHLKEIDTIIVPDYYYVAWLNNDYSGLDDDEIEEMENFFNQYEDCTFSIDDDVEPNFYSHNDVNNLGGNCYEVKVLKMVNEKYNLNERKNKSAIIYFDNEDDLLNYEFDFKDNCEPICDCETDLDNKTITISGPADMIDSWINGQNYELCENLNETSIPQYVIDSCIKCSGWSEDDVRDYLTDYWTDFVEIWNNSDDVCDAFEQLVNNNDRKIDIADSRIACDCNEEFTMGVGAPLGADQGIPNSMQCCAIPMMKLGDPAPYGKIQKIKHKHIGAEPFWTRKDMTIGLIKKKRKKRRRK